MPSFKTHYKDPGLGKINNMLLCGRNELYSNFFSPYSRFLFWTKDPKDVTCKQCLYALRKAKTLPTTKTLPKGDVMKSYSHDKESMVVRKHWSLSDTADLGIRVVAVDSIEEAIRFIKDDATREGVCFTEEEINKGLVEGVVGNIFDGYTLCILKPVKVKIVITRTVAVEED